VKESPKDKSLFEYYAEHSPRPS